MSRRCLMLNVKQSRFRTVGIRPTQQQEKTVSVKRVPFYNWLEERD